VGALVQPTRPDHQQAPPSAGQLQRAQRIDLQEGVEQQLDAIDQQGAVAG
jgi:hypothetical protein